MGKGGKETEKSGLVPIIYAGEAPAISKKSAVGLLTKIGFPQERAEVIVDALEYAIPRVPGTPRRKGTHILIHLRPFLRSYPGRKDFFPHLPPDPDADRDKTFGLY